MDDFEVKYFNKEDIHYFIHLLPQHDKLSINLEGKHYYGFTLHWNYNSHWVDITMQDCIPSVLKRFQHNSNKNSKYTSHQSLLTYNQKTRQTAIKSETSPLLPPLQKIKIQQINGSLLYYTRTLDNIMLVALTQ